MDNILKEGEQMMSGGNNNQGSNSNDQQQSGGNQSGGSGGGFMGKIEKQGEDQMLNQQVDNFATKEGIPSSMDNEINQFVDKEV